MSCIVIPEEYREKLKGRIYGVLCEREKNGNWEKFLNSIIVEVYGFSKNTESAYLWAFLGKLCSLKFLNDKTFRNTIFECMNIVSGI